MSDLSHDPAVPSREECLRRWLDSVMVWIRRMPEGGMMSQEWTASHPDIVYCHSATLVPHRKLCEAIPLYPRSMYDQECESCLADGSLFIVKECGLDGDARRQVVDETSSIDMLRQAYLRQVAKQQEDSKKNSQFLNQTGIAKRTAWYVYKAAVQQEAYRLRQVFRTMERNEDSEAFHDVPAYNDVMAQFKTDTQDMTDVNPTQTHGVCKMFCTLHERVGDEVPWRNKMAYEVSCGICLTQEAEDALKAFDRANPSAY